MWVRLQISKVLVKFADMVFNSRLSLARVAELVDALDLGSSGVTRESSSLSSRTSYITQRLIFT